MIRSTERRLLASLERWGTPHADVHRTVASSFGIIASYLLRRHGLAGVSRSILNRAQELSRRIDALDLLLQQASPGSRKTRRAVGG